MTDSNDCGRAVELAVREAEAWAKGLVEIADRIGTHFPRSEPRQRALAYLKGLISPIERKNSWQLAELAGDASPYGLQHLLGRAQSSADAVRDDLPHLADSDAVLIIDETGFIKKGSKSAGVARQYSRRADALRTLRSESSWLMPLLAAELFPTASHTCRRLGLTRLTVAKRRA